MSDAFCEVADIKGGQIPDLKIVENEEASTLLKIDFSCGVQFYTLGECFLLQKAQLRGRQTSANGGGVL
jgi:hypothetical protein